MSGEAGKEKNRKEQKKARCKQAEESFSEDSGINGTICRPWYENRANADFTSCVELNKTELIMTRLSD